LLEAEGHATRRGAAKQTQAVKSFQRKLIDGGADEHVVNDPRFEAALRQNCDVVVAANNQAEANIAAVVAEIEKE
jgi:predicted aspartyl protease